MKKDKCYRGMMRWLRLGLVYLGERLGLLV